MSRSRSVAVCAFVAGPLLGTSLGASSALAAACTTAPVGTYTASGFSCNVGPVTFSDIVLSTTTSGSGTVTLSQIAPFTTTVNGVTEYGLDLFYEANTGFSGGVADVGWSYNVSGVPSLTDAFASLDGNTTGADALVALTETLATGGSGTVLKLTSAGTTSATFAPYTGWLHVIKDQNDFASEGSAAFSSIVGNAFSVGGIPEPSTWAMMLLGFAGLGYAGFRGARKERLQAI